MSNIPVLVYMHDCLLGQGFASILRSQTGYQVKRCHPADLSIRDAIENMKPQVIILNQEAEEVNHLVLAQILNTTLNVRLLVVNTETNFLHIIEHRFHEIRQGAEIFSLTQPFIDSGIYPIPGGQV